MKYIMEKGKRAEKKSSLSIGQRQLTDCCTDQEMKRHSSQWLLFLCPHYKEMISPLRIVDIAFSSSFSPLNKLLVCKGYITNKQQLQKIKVFFHQQKICHQSWITCTKELRKRPRNLRNKIKKESPILSLVIRDYVLKFHPIV